MNTEGNANQSRSSDLISLENQAKPTPKFDVSLVAGIFFIGISVGALIPVGMKFFGYWKVSSPSSHVSTSKSKADEVAALSPPALNQAVKADEAPSEMKVPKTDPREAPKHQVLASEGKVVERRGKLEAAISEHVTAPALKREAAAKEKAKDHQNEVAELEKKSAQRTKTSQKIASRGPVENDIIEEVSEGPSALEIQNLTAVYANQKATAQSGRLAMASAPGQSPEMVPPAAVVAPMPETIVDTPSLMLKTVPEKDKAPAALSINNASYSKVKLESCTKRCLLLGLDAFGQPVKAIINGPSYAQALMQHNGTINLSGQPRLVKNQQVLIVNSITFNLEPSSAGKTELPAGVNASFKQPSYDGKTSLKAKR